VDIQDDCIFIDNFPLHLIINLGIIHLWPEIVVFVTVVFLTEVVSIVLMRPSNRRSL
jgi:hypothetical protein